VKEIVPSAFNIYIILHRIENSKTIFAIYGVGRIVQKYIYSRTILGSMVGEMLFRNSIVKDVLESLARRVSKTRELLSYESLSTFIVDSPDDLFNMIVSAAKQYASDIVSEFDKLEDRREVAVFLRYLVSWAPEARAYLHSVPDEVVDILRNYILYRIGVSKNKPELDTGTIVKLTRYLPLRVSIGNKDYYVIAPSFREPGLTNIEDDLLNVLKYVYLYFFDNLSYDPYTQTVMLGGKALLHISDEKEFIDKIRVEFSSSLLVSKVMRGTQLKYAEVLKKSLGNDFTFDSEVLSDYAVRLVMRTTTTSLAEKLGVKIPEEMRDRSLRLSIELSAASWDIHTVFEVESKVVDNVITTRKINLYEADKFGAKLPELFVSAMELVDRWEKLASTFKEKLRMAGFEPKEDDQYTLKYVLKRGSCKISVKSENIAYDEGPLMVTVTVSYNDLLDIERVESVLTRYGYASGIFRTPWINNDEKRSTTIVTWRDIALSSEDMIAEFVDKLLKLDTVLTEAKPKRVSPLEAVPLGGSRSFAAYLILLFDPAKFHFDVSSVLYDVKQWLTLPDVVDALNEDVKKALRLGRDEVLITEGDKIILSLFEKGKLKIVDDKIRFGISTIDFRSLGFNDAEAKEMLKKILSKMAMSADVESVAGIWHMLSDDVKKAYIEGLQEKDLIKILTSDSLSAIFSDASKAILERAMHSNPVLKTLACYRYMKDVFGTKWIELTTEPGVPAISAGMFYVHIYNVDKSYIDYVIYGKNEKIGIVYRGKTLREALNKAVKTYEKVVRKASWARSSISFGSLWMPLKDGKPIYGDEYEEESAEILH